MAEKNIKILMVSHGHPRHIAGGGEIAAYNLHKKIVDSEGFESVFFARHDKPELVRGGTSFTGTGRPNEILFYSTMPDWFRFSQPDKAKIWRDFRELLEFAKPDVVHFHHYVHLGLEMFREVKRLSPDTKIVLTLHEYFAICHNHGQMVKTTSDALCSEATPTDCSACFTEYSPQDFFLRNQFIKSHFAMVDQFISPSQFLKDRYTAWGIDESKIQVIENLLDDSVLDNEDRVRSTIDRKKVKLGYFGQVNWYKGLDLLLQAIEELPDETQQRISVDINGSGLEKQDAGLRNKILSMIDKLDGCVTLNGPYERHELDKLMGSTDWLIAPSKWWENSPMVILEAKKNGLPVICSDIGGMAEKVDHGVTGLHFKTGSSASLSAQIEKVVNSPQLQTEFARTIVNTYQPELALQTHLAIYKSLFGERAPATQMDLVRVA